MNHSIARLLAGLVGRWRRVPGSRSVFRMALLLLGLCIPNAQAGVYTDDLSKCLVKSTNTNDRVVLVQWMFATLTLHPAVRSFVSVPDQQRDTATKAAAALFARLLTADCRKETVNALKYEGVSAIGSSFQVLGQVASRDLMTDPNVSKGMKQLGTDLDSDQRLKDLLKDAGITGKGK
jgi:hypothetical protein